MGCDADSPSERESGLRWEEAEPVSVCETEGDCVAADGWAIDEALFAPLALDTEVWSEVTGLTRE